MSGECSVTAFQRVGVTTEVTITPHVECGPLSVTCLPGRIEPAGDECSSHKGKGRQESTCKVVVFQELCVAIPLFFSVEAACETTSVDCGPASLDPGDCLDESGDDSSSSSSSSSSSGSSSSSSSSSSSCTCTDDHDYSSYPEDQS